MAKGYTQKEGIDYEETFAPVVWYTSIRSVISLVAQMGWEIHQMDVKTVFLNGVIEEEVYIEPPKGFETHEHKTHVCRLKKALYGLKQAPRAWYGQIGSYLQKMGFVKSDADRNLYYLRVGDEPLILVLYVDDLFLIGSFRLIKDRKEKSGYIIRHEGSRVDALFSGVRSLAAEGRNLPWARKIYYRDSEEISDGEL